MAQIANVKRKLKRAKAHLDALDVEIAKFAKKETYMFSSKDDAERGEYVVTVRTKGKPPLDCAIVAGEFIGCLRSALDYLAFQLSSMSGKAPSSEVSFPVFGENSVDTQVRIARKTYGIPDPAVVIIKALQPYNSGNAYKSTYLWRLNKLWNIDKHRHIPLYAAIGYVNLPRLPFALKPEIDVLNQGGVSEYIMRFPAAAKPYVDLKPRVSVDVQFGRDSEGVVVSRKDLHDMYEFVSNEVVPRFARFFK